MHGLGQLLGVVRIHNQRVLQLAACACEQAQNERPAVILAGCNEFLRHQVHPVMQRSHQAQVRYTIVRFDLVMVVVSFQKHDRLPVSGLESPIDAFRLALDLRNQFLIAIDMGTARRADLHEREAALIGGVLIQESLDAAEPLWNSLGIVQAIDADAEVVSMNI